MEAEFDTLNYWRTSCRILIGNVDDIQTASNRENEDSRHKHQQALIQCNKNLEVPVFCLEDDTVFEWISTQF